MNVHLKYIDSPCTSPTKTYHNRCSLCNGDGKYKCPICLVYYCSVACCKKHRDSKCQIAASEEPIPEVPNLPDMDYLTESTVPEERLQLLANDQVLKDLLNNPHLRGLLKTVDESKKADEIMEKAMQEPLFVEFADSCLKVVDPKENTQNGLPDT